MLRDRGYAVAQDIYEQSKEQFEMSYNGQRESLSMMVTSRIDQAEQEEEEDADSNRMLIFFVSKERLNKDDLVEIGLKCLNQKSQNCIIVLKGMTPIAQKDVETLSPLVVESFFQSDLFVNITEHELVPNHSILSKEGKESLLRRYRAKENQLPKIQ